jgi:hypothetical protein
MKHHTALHFRTDMSLEQLASVVGLQDFELDCENEDEWVIGSCYGVSKIDICRTHKVLPLETDTTVLRYGHEMESVIPTDVLTRIAQSLITNGAGEISVTGFDTWGEFLYASAEDELGI